MKNQYLISRLFLGCAVLAFNSGFIFAQHEKSNGVDAVLHYTISSEIAFASCWIITSNYPDISLKNKYLIGAGIGILAGVGKEFFDLASGRDFSFIDIGFDLLGIGSGLNSHYVIFDKKIIRSSMSFNISDHNYLATIRISF